MDESGLANKFKLDVGHSSSLCSVVLFLEGILSTAWLNLYTGSWLDVLRTVRSFELRDWKSGYYLLDDTNFLRLFAAASV